MQSLIELSPLELSSLDYIRNLRRLSRHMPRHGAAYVIFPPPSHASAEGLSISASADDDPIGPQPRPLFRPPVRAMKWRGEVAQIQFAHAAMAQNLIVALPLTDCIRVDSVILAPRRPFTVQIKTTTVKQCAGWLVTLALSPGRDGKRRYYRRNDFDVLAVLIPGDVWYLFPHHVVAGRRALILPRRPQLHYKKLQIENIEQYREAWHIFR
jgi:hypothetical protein